MSLTHSLVNFNTLEDKFFQEGCKAAQIGLANWLSELDQELCNNRDKKKYRHNGYRKRTIKTKMGDVEVKRVQYLVANPGPDEPKVIYLLDEALGLNRVGCFSELLVTAVLDEVSKSSFRETAKTISATTGESISHTGVWNIVQTVGDRLETIEDKNAQLARENKGKGSLKSKVLFEEQDGLWLFMQGASRRDGHKKREIKIGICYAGCKEVSGGRYALAEKVACASFDGSKKFLRRKEGLLASKFDMSFVEARFLNGDGAGWIKRTAKLPNTFYQLDPYHRNKKILECVGDKIARETIFTLLKAGNVNDLLQCIESYRDSAAGTDDYEKLNDLLVYFSGNKTALRPYQDQYGKPIQVNEGLVARNMGCVESNVFTLLGNRMSGRRKSWSKAGAANMARILCLRETEGLSDAVASILAPVLSEPMQKEVDIFLPASKIPETVGKGYDGYCQATIPSTSNMKWMRDIAHGWSL